MVALLASNPRYIRYFKYYSRKISRQLMPKNLRYQEDVNWHWLRENPIPIAGLNRSIWRLSVASFSFQFMLGLSAIIATLGLISNSAAVIIGAELVIEKNVSYQIKDFILSQSKTFADFDVRSIQVASEKNYLRVSIEVTAPLNSISQNQINLVREALENKIGSPIDLQVEVIPRQVLNSAYQQ